MESKLYQLPPNIKLKYQYAYPVLISFYVFLLLVLIADTFLYFYPELNFSTYFYLVIIIFFMEAVISSQVRFKKELPVILILIELGFFTALLYFLKPSGFFYQPIVIMLLCIFFWANIYGQTRLFNQFLNRYKKIIKFKKEGSKGDALIQNSDLKKTFAYYFIWENIVKWLVSSNLIIVIIFIIRRSLSWKSALISTAVFLIQLYIISDFYYDKINLDWIVEDVKTYGDIKRKWKKILLVVITFALVFSMVLPINHSLLSYKTIGGWINSITENITFEPPEQHISNMPVVEQNEEIMVEENKEDGISFAAVIIFIIYAIFIGIIAFIIISVVMFLLKSEIKRWKEIPLFFKEFLEKVKDFFKEFFNGIREHTKGISRFIGKKEFKNKKRRNKNLEKPGEKDVKFKNPIARIYYSMLNLLEKDYNSKRRNHQTPYEYAEEVKEKNPKYNEEISYITDVFVEYIYSDHQIKKIIIKRLKRVWKKLKKRKINIFDKDS